ncbi:MAG: Crp/Fnr family transcriptional regulator [Rhodobacteraceae bacterium]|nr:Crp/Fnr family transcriptional regulator [Paracoccaceae bacterium]
MDLSTAPEAIFDRLECRGCPVREHAICSYCSPDEFQRLNRIRRVKTYARGSHITRLGDRLTEVGSLLHGTAYLSRSLEDGRRQIVGLLMPGDFIGRPGRRNAGFDIIAGSQVELCQFRMHDFEAILETSPTVNRRLLEMTFDELDAARLWMMVLGRANSREKLASLIALLVQHSARQKCRPINDALEIELPFGRTEIAEYLGLTIETVSRRLSELRNDGLIRIKGRRRIHVLSYQALARETGDSDNWLRELQSGFCLGFPPH